MTRVFSSRLSTAVPVALLAVLLASCASDRSAVRGGVQTSTVVEGDVALPASEPADNLQPAVALMPDDGKAASGTEVAPDANATALGSEATTVSAVAQDDPRTQAEQDFDAIYGSPYDPVYDPTLPAAAQQPQSYDPWEPLNRKVYAFNKVVDRVIAKPLAKAYVAVVPVPVRLGVGNFFNNLGQPGSSVNALLQGKPKQAGQSLARFLVNSTIGVAGIFDPATKFHIPNKSEDFGQTLGVWGYKRSRFIELPLFGPRTVRDTFGLLGDAPLAPLRYVEDDKTRVFLQGLQLVDVRTQLFAVDGLLEGATDEYALVRDSWLQRRNYQIAGDSGKTEEGALPDYLRDDDSNPSVPVDVMPIVPGSQLP